MSRYTSTPKSVPHPRFAEHLPKGTKANGYHATVRAETDTVDSNLRNLGRSLSDIRRWLTCDLDPVRSGSLLRDFYNTAKSIAHQIRRAEQM